MITREFIDRIVVESRMIMKSEALEAIVRSQEDASLRSPGVEAHYYRFLYRLAQETKPRLSLELGTHTGISAACLAEGNPDGKVVTVDIAPFVRDDCRRSNIQYQTQDSLTPIRFIEPIDILFLDTNHDGVHPLQEYLLYKDFMSPNGVIFFDDIFLLECMKKFWEAFIPERGEKFEIPVHGGAGFGVVLLRPVEA